MHYIFPFSLDIPITIFSAISMVVLGYTFRIILKSKRTFLNVSFSKNNDSKDDVNKIIVHVAITDSDEINSNQQISNSLIDVLKEYGAIIIKITDGTITKEIVASFSKQLYSYTSSTKNRVTLAIIIGYDASQEPDFFYKQIQQR